MSAPSPRLPFIIYTPERTGSTTLARLLNCHSELRCQLEPFNPGFKGPTHFLCQTLLASQGIEAAVQSLWSYGNFNGFKHVWHTDGWPFQSKPEFNHWLLTRATSAIIVLARRNALQRAISGQISEQIGVWVPQNDAERQRIKGHRYGPLDVERLRREITLERAQQRQARDLVAASGKPWRAVAYEDYFAPALTMAQRMAAVQSLFEFLGVPAVTDPQRLVSMEWLLDPAHTGFQNAAAYARIPNIQAVERELGSDETGHVFDKT